MTPIEDSCPLQPDQSTPTEGNLASSSFPATNDVHHSVLSGEDLLSRIKDIGAHVASSEVVQRQLGIFSLKSLYKELTESFEMDRALHLVERFVPVLYSAYDVKGKFSDASNRSVIDALSMFLMDFPQTVVGEVLWVAYENATLATLKDEKKRVGFILGHGRILSQQRGLFCDCLDSLTNKLCVQTPYCVNGADSIQDILIFGALEEYGSLAVHSLFARAVSNPFSDIQWIRIKEFVPFLGADAIDKFLDNARACGEEGPMVASSFLLGYAEFVKTAKEKGSDAEKLASEILGVFRTEQFEERLFMLERHTSVKTRKQLGAIREAIIEGQRVRRFRY